MCQARRRPNHVSQISKIQTQGEEAQINSHNASNRTKNKPELTVTVSALISGRRGTGVAISVRGETTSNRLVNFRAIPFEKFQNREAQETETAFGNRNAR